MASSIDLDRLDEKQRDALLRTLLQRGTDEDAAAYELAVATADDGYEPLAQRGRRAKPAEALAAPAPGPPKEEPVKKEPAPTPSEKQGPQAPPEQPPSPLRAYIVPAAAVDSVMAAYNEPSKRKVEDAISWAANQLRVVYETEKQPHQIFWGTMERAAFDTLAHNRALAKETQALMLEHMKEFDDFIAGCDDREQLAFLDLPQIAQQVTAPEADLKSLEPIFKSRFQRVRKSHLYVYVDFLRVTRPFAILLKKEADYKARGMNEQQIKRKLASARAVIQSKLKDVDPFVVHLYVEILRHALSTAGQHVRDEAFDRVELVLGVGRSILAKREKLGQKQAES